MTSPCLLLTMFHFLSVLWFYLSYKTSVSPSLSFLPDLNSLNCLPTAPSSLLPTHFLFRVTIKGLFLWPQAWRSGSNAATTSAKKTYIKENQF